MSIEPESIPSGIPGFDPILGGGLPRRGVLFVVGAPGTGKTVFLQQIAFTAAAAGRTALYFSGFSESHERLVEHIRPFTFFDEAVVGQRVQLFSLTAALTEGTDNALTTIVRTVRRTQASLVLLDGFRGVQGLLADESAVVQFLYTLGAQLGLMRTLLVVALEANPHAESLYPELATGDGIIGLFLERAAVGHRRSLEVLKRRGAAPLLGVHTFTIADDGINCYPQFELMLPDFDPPFDSAQRAPFDLPELDMLLHGGLTQQTTTILAGSPGTGKTLLGLQFLAAGVAHGEPGVLLGFHETRAQLLDKAAAHHIDLAGALARGQIQLLLQSPVTFDPDIVAYRLQEAINAVGARRLVVDSIVDLESAVAPDRVDAYLAAIVALVRGRGVTAILNREITKAFALDVDFAELPISVLAENVLILRQIPVRGEMHRVLAVVKMRFSDHDRTFREFTIGPRGLTVLGRWQSAPEILGAADDAQDPGP